MIHQSPGNKGTNIKVIEWLGTPVLAGLTVNNSFKTKGVAEINIFPKVMDSDADSARKM